MIVCQDPEVRRPRRTLGNKPKLKTKIIDDKDSPLLIIFESRHSFNRVNTNIRR